MAGQAETTFVKSFLNTLSNQPVTYADDYQQPAKNSLKKVPVLPIALPAPPERKRRISEPSAASITLTFKSLKPQKSFTIPVQPTDSIQSVKALLASQPGAPPANAQRLLLKGKALADAKLLQEYSIKDGDTVNLMIKPSYNWDPNSTSTPTSTQANMTSTSKENPKLGHSRIPSVVLSPSPSSVSPLAENNKPLDINLTLDTSSIPTASSESSALSTYHSTISQPGFWDRLHSFLRTEFSNENDALIAFEDFLRASKGTLTASEIAKIRDQVGVVGMAGT
jgi:UV excision repair protein RAD23